MRFFLKKALDVALRTLSEISLLRHDKRVNFNDKAFLGPNSYFPT